MATFKETETEDASDRLSWDGVGLPPGVMCAALAFLGVVTAAAIPYFVPDDACVELGEEPTCASDFRAWVEDDGIPFSKLFSLEGTGPRVAEASGNAPTAEQSTSGAEAKLIAQAKTIDDDNDEAFDDAPKLAVAPKKSAPEPGALPSPATPPGEGPAKPTETKPAAAPKPEPSVHQQILAALPPETHSDVEVAIEDPSGALKHFYEALTHTAQQQPKAVTRISHWGDSTIAADGMTSVTRRQLQKYFGDSGHGFVLVESGSRWYVHKGVEVDGGGWRSLKIINASKPGGHYGLGGVAAQGYLGANATFSTAKRGPVGRKVGRFDLFYLKNRGQAPLRLYVDGGEPVELETAAEQPEDAVHSIRLPDGPHSLKIRAGGPVKVYGVALERERPGVVYDCLGIVGARASRLLNADAEHWSKQLELRDPDLMIIQFGGNELVDRGMKMSWYRPRYEAVIKRFREGHPEASCLVMSPIDHGEKHRGRIRTKPDLLNMLPVQREVALANGCAFFSLFDAMGGEGSMGRWYRMKPALGWADFAHVTKHGAKVLGNLVFKTLMKGFADYLRAR